MSGELLNDLRKQIASGHALIVVGAGVSVGATGGAPTASWGGLLQDGIARVEELAPRGLPEDWGEVSRRQLESGELHWLLGVAEDVTVRLGGPNGGEYRRWLHDAIGGLELRDRSAIDALLSLDAPIATTNYDGLIEAASGLAPVTWRDGARIQRVLRGDERAILHLHGHWDDPRSVVLGVRSYEDVLRGGAAQALQQAMMAVRSLVLIGFGAGLGDPNFAALRGWFADRFGDSEYRHYRLCRADEREALSAEHASEERIVPLVYGEAHADLARFMRSLAPASAATAAVAAPPPVASSALPPRPVCVGRDAQLERLAGDLASGVGPIGVLGPPGIGKSTVCLAAAHDPRVADRFGARRWFVRCDGATSAPALLSAVAEALGISSSGGPEALVNGVLQALEAEDCLIVLDNLETPWAHDPQETEQLLARLAAAEPLTLVGAVRGAARPGGLGWERLVTVIPLEREDARVVFLAIAGDLYAEDPHLDELLDELDGLPLAVELLAHAAQGEPNLDGLTKRWQVERVALLERLGGGHPALSVSASVEVSWTSPLMRPEGRRLLSLLGQLPDGVAHVDIEPLLGEKAFAAASNARQLGLAFDEDDRLRTLAPIREHLHREHPPDREDDARLVAHYLHFAVVEGERIGWPGGGNSVRRLAPESGNLNTLFEREDVQGSILGQAGLLAALRYGERTGNVIPAAFAAAQAIVASPTSAREVVARIHEGLGDIALSRFELDAAREHFRAAHAIFEALGDVVGQATCTNCLGHIAWREQDYEAAWALFEQALQLNERAENPLGQANCLAGLGALAWRRLDYDAARSFYERALPLYVQAGDTLGHANCLRGLGDIALQTSDVQAAAGYYNDALPLYESVGDLLGPSNCMFRLGELAHSASDDDRARELFMRALDGYTALHKPYSIGFAHAALARIARSESERRLHADAALAAWTAIGRPDLIEKHLP